eukprot:jgi/Botrbrau1/10141/Bobra.0191s0012.1
MNSVVRYSHVVARSTRDLATLVFERQAEELNVICLALSMIALSMILRSQTCDHDHNVPYVRKRPHPNVSRGTLCG